jgi:hypothetical protein
VVIGHGHSGDAWNRIPPARVHRALETGRPSLPLPPGSLLVLDTINAFKRACDPHTGAPRFSFVDLLKPEGPWVPLLLLAFDPRLALAHLPGVAGRGKEALLRAVAQRLRGGATLAGPATAGASDEDGGNGVAAGRAGPAAAGVPDEDGEDGSDAVAAGLADALLAALTPGERAAPRALLDRLGNALDGAAPAAPGTLAAGPAAGLFLRAAHRLWHDGGSFFDPAHLGALDRAIVAEHLPEGCGPRVVVAGHTHAAREARPAADRVYLNTGTWTDLLRVPEEADAEALARWAGELRAGTAPRLRRLHYAEIAPGGAQLKAWPGGSGGAASEASP